MSSEAENNKEVQNPDEESQLVQLLPIPEDLKNLPYLDYGPQSHNDIIYLDTENDRDDMITIKNILRKIRDVYGAPPVDMRKVVIPWDSWDVSLVPKLRTSPYDYPAFKKQMQEVKKYRGDESKRQNKDVKGQTEKTKTPNEIVDMPFTDLVASLADTGFNNCTDVTQPEDE